MKTKILLTLSVVAAALLPSCEAPPPPPPVEVHHYHTVTPAPSNKPEDFRAVTPPHSYSQ
jgi:hypothetical protein